MIIGENSLRKKIRKILVQESLVDSAKSFLGLDGDSGGDLGALNFEFISVENSGIVNIVEKENKFWQNGKVKEKDEKAYSRLKTYWDNLTDDWPESRWTPDTPWSAAFVSYCNKKSGETFYDSAAHTVYATKALKNRQDITKNPSKFVGKTMHVLFLKGEAEPAVGDGLFYLRGGNLGSWISSGGGQSPSHTDIFIGGGLAAGGNLSNSCVKTKAFGKHEALIKKVEIKGAKESADSNEKDDNEKKS